MDARTAQSVFGGIVQSKKPASKEEISINYKTANDSLVKKNLLLKQQLVQFTKTIEKLRNENVSLREKNQALIDATLEKKIELIVEQRVKSRLAHAAVLHKKLVQNIQQTGLELGQMFKELEPEPSSLVTRRQPKLEINLERLDESPVRNIRLEDSNEENADPIEELDETAISYPATNLKNETPRKKNSLGKGRRSELFQSFHEQVPTTQEVPSTSNVIRRAPMLIAPIATPGVSSKPTPRKAQTPRFKKPSTPAPAPVSDDIEVSSTARRQRSAKMNIKSFKEPSVRDKLRRPGKHDEPMPFIDTFY
ncbi:CBN-SGO-1 protein [Caenorhabditis brenneri]|uniref:CBN-SGO-1 protein n=1 Tax=Caenorhabditis brenneri TaxID=135651 RepID=G0NG77_CAEBE|nr:CBN-SGO-1 protein [Caenorhabditis brenneri]